MKALKVEAVYATVYEAVDEVAADSAVFID